MSTLAPFSAELWAHNRRLRAARERWPQGVLRACEQLDRRYPDWWITWQPECRTRGYEHPAGYVADGRNSSVAVCGRSVATLQAAISAAPEHEGRWQWRDRCCIPRPVPILPPRFRRRSRG